MANNSIKKGISRWYKHTVAVNNKKKAYARAKANTKYASVRKVGNKKKTLIDQRRGVRTYKSVNTRRTYWAYATGNAGT